MVKSYHLMVKGYHFMVRAESVKITTPPVINTVF